MRRAAPILYPLFLLSGFCGLIYESIWAKYLKLFLGHAAYAQAVVLVVFIGGMAIGAWLCGRWASRIRNPLLAYAVAEFAIGVAALSFHRLFVSATDWAYVSLLPTLCAGEGLCISSWVFAASLILPQSILLGTTFPLMAAGVIRLAPERSGRIIATLYFLNSFGAVFGVLAATFVLVPAMGLPGASLSAGAANIVLAAIVFLYARTAPPPATIEGTSQRRTPVGATVRTLLAVALLTGLTSFVYEVVWIRMLSVVLGASTHAFELMLASFILGLALGGAWVRNRIDGSTDPRRFLAIVQILMGLLAVGTLALYNQMYEVMAWLLASLARSNSGYVLFNVGSSFIAVAIMLPATFMAGMTLPLITQLLMRAGHGERSVGYVYAWNTFGGIIGVLLAIHIGLPFLGLKSSLGFAAFVDVAIGIHLLVGATSPSYMRRPAIAAASITALATLFAWSDIDRQRMAASVFRSGVAKLGDQFSVVFAQDGKTATITVLNSPNGIRSIQTNGKTEASIDVKRTTHTQDEQTQTLAAALPFAFQPQTRNVAIIGFGSGMTTASVLAQPDVRRVDTIEIEPAMVAGAQHFRPLVDAAFIDERSHVIYDDARSYLARTGRRYDAIISEPSNPWVSGVASLFTTEFYSRMHRALEPGGLLVQWVQMYEMNGRTVSSISKAMGSVFVDFVVFRSGSDLLFVARRDGKLGLMKADLFRHERVQRMLAQLGISSAADFEIRRVGGRAVFEQLLATERVSRNSDYFPIVDIEAARARFTRSRVDAIYNLDSYALPVVDLFERRQWAASDWPAAAENREMDQAFMSAMAGTTVRALTQLILDGERASAALPQLPSDAAALHAVFVACVTDVDAPGLLDRALVVANLVNRSLPPVRAADLWALMARQTCSGTIPERARWLALWHAVALRDAPAMASLAITLLEQRRGPAQSEYLVLCAYAGLRASGREEDAEQFRTTWATRLAPDRENMPELRAIASLRPSSAVPGERTIPP